MLQKILDTHAEISIQDSGIGIPPQILKNIFAVDKSPSCKGTAKETGIDLGLVICFEFAQLNNGSIRAQSEPNNETTFLFYFPWR